MAGTRCSPGSAGGSSGTMPSWLRGFAASQPVTPIVERLRGLPLDRAVGSAPEKAVAWCLALTAVSTAASALRFRAKTRG